jgi:hypothetical protein
MCSAANSTHLAAKHSKLYNTMFASHKTMVYIQMGKLNQLPAAQEELPRKLRPQIINNIRNP